VRLYTSTLAYDADDRLDVSRYGGHAIGVAFAPSLELLWWIKRRRATRDLLAEYMDRYRAEMRTSQRERPEAWASVLACDEVTCCCYCVNASACHRAALAEMLVAMGAEYRGER